MMICEIHDVPLDDGRCPECEAESGEQELRAAGLSIEEGLDADRRPRYDSDR